MRSYERPTLTALNLPTARAEDPVPEGTCKTGDWVGDPEWGTCGTGDGPADPNTSVEMAPGR